VRIGLMLPPQLDLGQVVPLARRAELLGYDFLACGEHVLFHVPHMISPDQREYADAGAETVIFSPACTDWELERMAALFAEEVAPALRPRA
jgi:alkanesulfonate monooxygenase SsuD/methylene tetrahydromethanopterin reductase-like flavin-dependent oxidoreductase (luciferase family)